MKVCMITTLDNPFDPFDNFEEWYLYDVSHGYNTCGKLARIALNSPQLSIYENNQATEDAIDDIIRLDPTGMYKKNYYEDEEPKEIELAL